MEEKKEGTLGLELGIQFQFLPSAKSFSLFYAIQQEN